MNDDVELDESAERVRDRLAAEGAPLPIEFVRDVAYQYVVLTAQHPALALPAGRANASKQVASALFEDESIVRRIIDALVRDHEAHPPAIVDPTASASPPVAPAPRDPDAGEIAARLNDAGFPVTTDLAGRVLARYLALLMASDEALDDRSARPAVARRIASEIGEDEALVRRVVAEIALVLGSPDRFEPTTEQEQEASLAEGSAAVADEVRRLGLVVTPADVLAVVGELVRLTGDPLAPVDEAERRVAVAQVAEATGRPAELVSAICEEMLREELLPPRQSVTSAEPPEPRLRRRKRPASRR